MSDGDTIQVVVSKTIPAVPNVTGLGVYMASSKLKRLGYSVHIKKEISTAPEGRVLSQSVGAGKRAVPPRTTITLTVAKPQPGVFFEVTGAGSALVTILDSNLSTRQATVSLPYETKVAYGQYGISVSAQRQLGDGGSITCTIIDNGRVVKRSTSSGPYSICSLVYS